MDDLTDAIAVSLLWTTCASRRPRRARRTESRHLDEPWPDGRAISSLETRLHALGDQNVDAAAASLRAEAIRVLEAARAKGIAAIPLGSPDYPIALARISDAPPVLWSRGDLRPDDCAVAIVGSRAATPHALEMAFRLGEGLARAGVVVVSGLARGVDAAAHRGALAGDGRTLAVLGSGVDVIYPPEHARLARQVADSGAIVSELAPGSEPLGWHFPRRNRLISGLAGGVVVVEASAHSGSLITADQALNQGRPVMAVPGGVLSGRNRGAHSLIKAGACMVEHVDDVLEELHYVGAPVVRAARNGGFARPPQDPVLWAMKVGEPYDVAFLSEQVGVEAVRVLAALSQLELGGWIQRVGGGRFVRLGPDVLS